MNRLYPRLNTVFMATQTRAPETRTASLRKFINSNESSELNILKLKTNVAKERILNTARKYLEESNPTLINFEENVAAEIKRRNQSLNNHLDNKVLRIRHKSRYDSLLTNWKLHEWKIVKSEVCSFCGIFTENMDYLLNNCKVLKALWDDVK